MAGLTVVGLGPGGADLVLPAARQALEAARRRFVRTARHPAVEELRAEGVEFEAFDRIYEQASDLDAVYPAIVAELLAATEAGDGVVYAVPGSPVVAERTVVLLREALGDELVVVPGVSFADLAWTRLGIDPLGGARVVDARAFAIDAANACGPLLIAQCDMPMLVSDVKLSLLDVLDAGHEVVVLAHLGLSTERVARLPLEDLDRGSFVPDHLTSVFVDTGGIAIAPEFARLVALTERLRGPGGCPWDAKQTHHSLARHLLEEAYEVVEAIEGLPSAAPGDDLDAIEPGAYEALEDELGDLLFQAVIHSVLAAEAGAFTIADVLRGIHDKLVRRHPHVFGDVELDTADDVVRNWEQIKRGEKTAAAGHGEIDPAPPVSLVAGIATTLPGLLYLPKVFRKATAIGLDLGAGALAELETEVAALAGSGGDVGAVIAAAAAVAWSRDVDPEAALRAAAERRRDWFVRMEQIAAERGVDLAAADPVVATELWDLARGADPA